MRFLLAGRDVTSRVEREHALLAAQTRLEKVSQEDALTGLANRKSLWASLDKLMDDKVEFAVLQMDMNDFKAVNDTHGHNAGDAILAHFAGLLKEMASEEWTLARAGGDEFTILIPEMTDLADAVAKARRIFHKTQEPMPWNSGELCASVSVGVAMSDCANLSSDEILHRGDVALYTAKGMPGIRVAGYDDAMHSDTVNNQRMEREALKAVKNGEIVFHYQPIVDLRDCKLLRFEMLARWDHPERGIVGPDLFLPHIERLSMIADVDHLVIEVAAKTLKEMQARGLTETGLSINLSSNAMQTSTIPEALIWKMAETGINPSYVAVEVLETTAVSLADKG